MGNEIRGATSVGRDVNGADVAADEGCERSGGAGCIASHAICHNGARDQQVNHGLIHCTTRNALRQGVQHRSSIGTEADFGAGNGGQNLAIKIRCANINCNGRSGNDVAGQAKRILNSSIGSSHLSSSHRRTQRGNRCATITTGVADKFAHGQFCNRRHIDSNGAIAGNIDHSTEVDSQIYCVTSTLVGIVGASTVIHNAYQNRAGIVFRDIDGKTAIVIDRCRAASQLCAIRLERFHGQAGAIDYRTRNDGPGKDESDSGRCGRSGSAAGRCDDRHSHNTAQNNGT